MLSPRQEPGGSLDLSTGGRCSGGHLRLYSPHIQRDSSAVSSQFDVAFACCPFLAGSSVLERAPGSERLRAQSALRWQRVPRWSASYSWR